MATSPMSDELMAEALPTYEPPSQEIGTESETTTPTVQAWTLAPTPSASEPIRDDQSERRSSRSSKLFAAAAEGIAVAGSFTLAVAGSLVVRSEERSTRTEGELIHSFVNSSWHRFYRSS